MIDANSNCSRIDAVKAAANELKVQSSAANSATGATRPNDPAGKLKGDLQNLDTQIKSGDPKKAEIALEQTRKDEAAAEADRQKRSASQGFPAIDSLA
jgi:hypothetical protein